MTIIASYDMISIVTIYTLVNSVAQSFGFGVGMNSTFGKILQRVMRYEYMEICKESRYNFDIVKDQQIGFKGTVEMVINLDNKFWLNESCELKRYADNLSCTLNMGSVASVCERPMEANEQSFSGATLIRPHSDTIFHLFIRNYTIEIISTAYRFHAAELCFFYFNVHPSQEISDCLMYLWFMSVAAGIMYRYFQSSVIGQW